jgi:hypothetical protein
MEKYIRSNAIQESLPLSSLNKLAGGIDTLCMEQSEAQCGTGKWCGFADSTIVLGIFYNRHECVVDLDDGIAYLKFFHIIQVVQNWPIPYFHSFWSDEHSELWISLLAPIPPSP